MGADHGDGPIDVVRGGVPVTQVHLQHGPQGEHPRQGDPRLGLVRDIDALGVVQEGVVDVALHPP
jgi:hypothetical protein